MTNHCTGDSLSIGRYRMFLLILQDVAFICLSSSYEIKFKSSEVFSVIIRPTEKASILSGDGIFQLSDKIDDAKIIFFTEFRVFFFC